MPEAKLRPIDPTPFGNRLDLPKVDYGKEPRLDWLGIGKLRIDAAYQREIGGRGAKSVRDIAINFQWSRFGTVIVAPLPGGAFAIIDGQHRTTAAALRGIARVPCQIVTADQADQARAFAAINSQVTAITPMQMHAARVAAGDVEALQLSKVCEAAGVSICRYPVPAKDMKVGETLAAGQLYRLLARFGADVLAMSLRCVTKTRKGNAGMVRAPIIAAICTNLDAEPDWAKNETRLMAAMTMFDFAEALAQAGQRSFSERQSVTSILVDLVSDHLDNKLGSRAA